MTHETTAYIEKHKEELRAEHAKCEELGHLTDRTVEILKASGGFKILLSKDLGGYAAHPTVFGEWVRTVARYNPSAGWVAGVGGVHPWEFSIADERVRKEVYGSDPNTITASPYAPVGKISRVDGGFRFTTDALYSTGSDVSEWFILAGLVVDDSGKPTSNPPEALHLILPRDDVEIVPDSWNVMGLRGTGSNRIRVHDKFVPDYRMVDVKRVFAGDYGDAQPDEPLFRWPFNSLFGPSIAHALHGIAQGFIDHFVAYMTSRKPTFGAEAKHDPQQQRVLANAIVDLESSIALLDSALVRLHSKAVANEPFTVADRVAMSSYQKLGCARVLRSMNELWLHAGSASRWTNQPMEQYFRDLQVGGSHYGCDPTTIYGPFVAITLDPAAEPVGMF
ncbi:hypothetical protein LMK08_13145 [Metapseudomonas furukawaii]|uniref:hypothetical protein n=1 Tax=Metapseudomonas furukawaii TaxID=1149133 RepID=UPI00227B1ECE|nr:hypothetical protein [Pseudomonas furukawaii]WAG81560.1 hypothetical protein LMK08_13145 [Pseudomonas furukawaii]